MKIGSIGSMEEAHSFQSWRKKLLKKSAFIEAERYMEHICIQYYAGHTGDGAADCFSARPLRESAAGDLRHAVWWISIVQ